MTTLEYLMALVYSIDSEKNQRLADLIRVDQLSFLAYGVHTGEGGYETAIVNVLQNYDFDMAKCWIIATYTPSEMCLGMANVRALGGLAYLDSSKTIRLAIGNRCCAFAVHGQSPLRDSMNLTGQARQDHARLPETHGDFRAQYVGGNLVHCWHLVWAGAAEVVKFAARREVVTNSGGNSTSGRERL